jgi:hypothetical protein
MGPLGDMMPKVGVIEASRENGGRTGFRRNRAGVPGGDYDSIDRRPKTASSTSPGGQARANAIAAGCHRAVGVDRWAGEPVVPHAGNTLAKLLGLTKARMEILPVTFGFPFGFSVIMPPNLPLPTKIVTQVLEPIHITARFGPIPTSRRSTSTSAR